MQLQKSEIGFSATIGLLQLIKMDRKVSRKLAALTFQSLDGVMQSPSMPEEDPSNNFTHGGWAAPCWEDVMQQVMQEAMAEPYDLLLGCNTYASFAGHFSQAEPDNPVAKKLNQAIKYVVSDNLPELPWQNSLLIQGDIASEILKLKSTEGPLIQIHGSWQLIQSLLKFGLIDEFRIWTFPVVIGEGKRLFDIGTRPLNLKLLKTQSGPSGAVMQIYSVS